MYGTYAAGIILATWPLARAPATLWPRHHDPALWTWIMGSIARRLVTHPLALFDGSAYYPYGLTLAFSDPLVLPALIGFPGFVWGDPVLTYNLLVLLLWPLNGVVMAWAANELTGSWRAAWLAGAAFALCPYFTRYQVEFPMLLAAPVPLALVGWIRWLETQRGRWLVVALGALAAQGLTTWYYTIVLGLGLVTVTLAFTAMRWRGWRWRPLAGLTAGSAVVGAVLAPVAWPYVVLNRELGFERSLDEVMRRYADLFSFIDMSGHLVYPWSLTGGVPETSAFVGFSILGLAVASVAWVGRDRELPRGVSISARMLGVALLAALAFTAVGMALGRHRHWTGPFRTRLLPATGMEIAFGLGFGLLLLRGWATARAVTARALGRGDLVRALLLLAAVAAMLALGPELHVGGRVVGGGPYVWLYRGFWPLHAIRTTVRVAMLAIAALALLAALGWAWVESALARRPRLARGLFAGLCLTLALEYAERPPEYIRVPPPRPVDAVLRANPDDVVVLEWPTHAALGDTEAMFRSLAHGKRVVNGHSGFVPDSLHYLAMVLSDVGPPFPTPEAAVELHRLLGVQYVIVRLGHPDFQAVWRPAWLGLRTASPPWLRFRGTYGDDDLFEVMPVSERLGLVERSASFDFLRTHPILRLTVAPIAVSEDLAHVVTVRLNDAVVRRVSVAGRMTTDIRLDGPLHRAAENVLTLEYTYTRPRAVGDPRYRIGTTGVTSPVDLWVRSAGQLAGSRDSILVNGDERSPHVRGYNLVAIAPDGAVLEPGAFDTFYDPDASRWLAVWILALPRGTIVAGAVHDEASGWLSAEAVDALHQLGVASDLRGRFRASHAFVGVKGAATGTAVEGMSWLPVEIGVGQPGPKPEVELTGLTLISG
jgi:hypothetical protein